MNLYHLKRTDGWSFGDYSDFVVIALNEDQAKRLAAGKFGNTSWPLDGRFVTVTILGEAKEGLFPQIVISSYHN